MKCTLKEKWSHFNLKSWVTNGTKIWPVIQVIGECLSQIDSISSQFKLIFNIESSWHKYSPITWIPGQIFVPLVTQLFRSKWLHFSSSAGKGRGLHLWMEDIYSSLEASLSLLAIALLLYCLQEDSEDAVICYSGLAKT